MLAYGQEIVNRLSKAYSEEGLTLYLGAGVSVGNGLPTWEQLVLAMYFSFLSEKSIDTRLRPFPNYLFAIAEWHLERHHEPLEITARKIRSQFDNQDEFLYHLKQTLYAGFTFPDDDWIQTPDVNSMLEVNSTLKSVVNLCQSSRPGARGIRSVITYNYDNLLEIALQDYIYRPIWKEQHEKYEAGQLPIYHVHGYVPVEGVGSTGEEVIFSEEQYHSSASDPYGWANLIQIHCLSSSVGLMIGLSLTDRNMRRLLDAIRKTPLKSENYAILQKPEWRKPDLNEVSMIDGKARQYFEKFERSGIKTDERRFTEIEQIINLVEKFDEAAQEWILKQLGVQPIWYEKHEQIPHIIEEILDFDIGG